jgi:hypothetical protein
MYHPTEKAIATADWLKNQFMPQDLHDENYERWAEAGVQALPNAIDNNFHERHGLMMYKHL